MKEQVINIPIHSHLKKLILNLEKQSEPIKVGLQDDLGSQIYALSRSKGRQSIRPATVYNDRLKVQSCFKVPAKDLQIKKLQLINNFYKEYFKHHMFSWIQAQYEAGIPAYEGMKNFLKFYGIEKTEYSYETGYRAWLRFKNGEYNKTKKNYTPVS